MVRGKLRNIKLILEYDGTEFHGFQRQRRLRTVQGVLEDCFSRLLGEPIKVIGAGRTDAGVHALGQVVNFRTTRPVPMSRLAIALNRALPHDVKVQACAEGSEEFHARRCAIARSYCYTVIEREQPSPVLGRFALVIPGKLDVARMSAAAKVLEGRHDFAAFQAGGSEMKTTQRNLMRLECCRMNDKVCIIAESDSFLYQMVRLIVSALLKVGCNEMDIKALRRALDEGDRTRLPGPAPSCGLCLLKVSYWEGENRRVE